MLQLLRLVDRDLLAVLAEMLETDHAVGGGKQRVIAALAHVHTGVDVGTALTHQNVARQDLLDVYKRQALCSPA